jgi:uncharacterized protein YceK
MVKPLAQALLLAALLASLAGCTSVTSSPSASKTHWEIEVTGVVASTTVTSWGASTTFTFTFDDGRTYTLNNPNTISGKPGIGDLLIGGSKPSPWMMAAHPQYSRPEGCYEIDENGEEHDTSVELDVGVTLQKAPDFDPTGRSQGATRIQGAAICLNSQGQVMRIIDGGAK